MKDTIRTFIAVRITPEKKLNEIMNEIKKSLKGEEIRWVESNNLHITLRFLGETNNEQVSSISEMLERVIKSFQPFQFKLKGVGFFKSKKQPRVLHVTTENNEVLKQLANEIEDGLVQLGFGHGEKKFTPHLTLGRFKYIINKDSFYSLVNKFHDVNIQQNTVSEIIFYQSILSSGGPTYIPVKIFPLINLK